MSDFMNQVKDEIKNRKAAGLRPDNDAVMAILTYVNLTHSPQIKGVQADATFTCEIAGESKNLVIGWKTLNDDDDEYDEEYL